jgi:hypothetical protein
VLAEPIRTDSRATIQIGDCEAKSTQTIGVKASVVGCSGRDGEGPGHGISIVHAAPKAPSDGAATDQPARTKPNPLIRANTQSPRTENPQLRVTVRGDPLIQDKLGRPSACGRGLDHSGKSFKHTADTRFDKVHMTFSTVRSNTEDLGHNSVTA